MVRCEKVEAGYVVEMKGSFNDIISEIAYAAAVFHVKAIREDLDVNMDDEKDVKAAVRAAGTAFGLIVEEGIRKVLGIKHEGSTLDEVLALMKEKGGERQ